MSTRSAIVTLAVLISLGVAALASAAPRDEHRFKMTFTSKAPNSSTGLRFITDRFAYEPPPSGQPVTSRVTKTVFALHRGSRINTSAVPNCRRSTLERGPSACPAGSKVGAGSATLLTGFSNLDPVQETVQLFAKRGGFFAYLSGLQDVIVELGVTRGKIVTVLPRFCIPPGTPNDNCSTGEVVLTKLVARVSARTSKSAGPLVRTPRRCPRSGAWTNRVTYTYSNGDTETKTSRSPCRR